MRSTARRSAPTAQRAAAVGGRHGQARRARAQRVERHRPDLRLRPGRRDRRRRRGPRPRCPTRNTSRSAVKRIYALVGDTTEHGFVFRVDLALRPNGNSGPQRGVARRAGGVLPGAGPRVGALRLAQEPRGGAARRASTSGSAAGAARRGAALRVPPLPRLQRVRRAARAAPADPRAGGAAQRRPARARQRRQAVARRHPRDRVHRAAAAGGARRPVPRTAHARRRSMRCSGWRAPA